MAERIRDLLAHVDLREDERSRLEGRVSELAADVARWERQQREQGCLITELTRKTEDDLNTIMELQQRLAEVEEEGKHRRDDEPAAVSVQGPPQSVMDGSTGLATDYHLSRANKLPPESEQKVKEQEKEELGRSVASLREEQRETALAVQSQTEEKQRLTRTLWAMKEERDGLTGALSALKLEREQLTRAVCGRRDERDQLGRSLSALREERAWLAQALAELKVERETTAMEVLHSAGDGEGDQTTPPRSQEGGEESVQLECNFNLDGDGGLSLATGATGCLKQEHAEVPEMSHDASKEEREDLLLSICRLEEERGRTEQSIADLKIEEERVMLSIWSLKGERDALQAEAAAFRDQMQSEGRSQERLANRIHGEVAKTSEIQELSQVCRIRFVPASMCCMNNE